MSNAAASLLSKSGGLAELKSRLLFVLLAIVIFRIGSFIPVPGVDAAALAEKLQGNLGEIFNVFSGGALERASLFALGIMPYITASIIIQIMSHMYPALQQLRKEGEAGKRKISKYTRYLTLGLSIVQAYAIAQALPSMGLVAADVTSLSFQFYFVVIVSLVTGTMFLMWLGEQINERGIGNGISLLICIGIISGLPSATAQTLQQARQDEIHWMSIFVIIAIVAVVTTFVVFMERGQRRLVVNYAKRQQGRKVFAQQSSHLPFKINNAGVIPAIFASSIIFFPGTLVQWTDSQEGWLGWFSSIMARGEPLYVILYGAGIMFFSFFYTALTMNPRDTADNLKRSGAFIPGIRPGEQTSKYIDKVISRLTLVGASYVTLVCLLPEFMILFWQVPFQFGGTSLLILVVVVMDFMAQIQSHLMSQQYESVLKKANFKNYGQSGQLR